MTRTPSGTSTSFRLTHPLKQLRLTSTVVLGSMTRSRLLHPWNIAAGSTSAFVRKLPLLSAMVASLRSRTVSGTSVAFFAFSRLVMSWIIFRSLPLSGPEIFSSLIV